MLFRDTRVAEMLHEKLNLFYALRGNRLLQHGLFAGIAPGTHPAHTFLVVGEKRQPFPHVVIRLLHLSVVTTPRKPGFQGVKELCIVIPELTKIME